MTSVSPVYCHTQKVRCSPCFVQCYPGFSQSAAPAAVAVGAAVAELKGAELEGAELAGAALEGA